MKLDVIDQSKTADMRDIFMSQGGAQDFEDFIHLLSHDVRNSVRALIEVPQWIEEDLVAEGHRIDGSLEENLGMLNRHARRLDRMLVDLLVYSRVGRKQAIKNVDLQTMAKRLVDQVAIPPGFELAFDLQCKSIRIGDRDIFTLMTALILNAVVHHDRDTGKITVDARQAKDEIVIRVRDDGPGIPAKHRMSIFDAMTTLRPRDEVEGSGMGLAIARKIAETYGGSIGYKDRADERGACFEIRIPTA